MANDHLVSHTIRIAGKAFPVKLTEQELSLAPNLEKELNEKINEYRVKYAVESTQDILSMLLISYAFELSSSDQKSTISNAQERINTLIQMVSEQI